LRKTKQYATAPILATAKDCAANASIITGKWVSFLHVIFPGKRKRPMTVPSKTTLKAVNLSVQRFSYRYKSRARLEFVVALL